ncbi:3-hydroxyacyl-CoA dehydrogenase [Lysinibacillus sp. 2017]|uniref:3-hydroxyacyl-CoA dehydrogenase n=1 Tax=unclassified Lysinibacillus TaxID=2636778 RepID=UPI000D527989|nr:MULTISPECIES: 3-hydroxyacyl-CoA dehydrogenase [unclassified Lysinibacillus]AWE07259.1 3-hydroxyacyl-CoA dehydrogenase [Lysinibacillus sp. 2017]TGN33316.1 3-hydroxyacyl-CoA dehydrogenase [Lysinibacillus sp. S2017]
MKYKKVTIAGSGVLGSQIAFQSAFHGFEVSVYDINDGAIEAAKSRLGNLEGIYGTYFNDVARAEKAFASLNYYTVLAEAVKDADLVIEAVPERIEIKQSFYEGLAKVAPEKAVFASNSSTLLPSQFAKFTGRPEKFLALHFANSIWEKNTAEVMGHPGTDFKYVDEVTEFARSIGMIPFVLKKEQPGYILNSLLVPFLSAAMELWVKDIADPQTIDKNWMISTGAPAGPFAIYDIVGMETPYNLNLMRAKEDPAAQFVADKIKREMIDQGKMGVSTGEGFYKYPNPAYQDPNFLKSN